MDCLAQLREFPGFELLAVARKEIYPKVSLSWTSGQDFFRPTGFLAPDAAVNRLIVDVGTRRLAAVRR